MDAHPFIDFTTPRKNIEVLKANDGRYPIEKSPKVTIWNATLYQRKRKGVMKYGFRTTVSADNAIVSFTRHVEKLIFDSGRGLVIC